LLKRVNKAIEPLPLNNKEDLIEVVKDFLDFYNLNTMTREERLSLLYTLKNSIDKEIEKLLEIQKDFEAYLKHIKRAKEVEELKELHFKICQLAIKDFLENRSPRNLHHICTYGRDELTKKLILMVEKEMEKEGFGLPPVKYAWMSMGSEGRREQTLNSDQDNLIVYEEKNKEKLNVKLDDFIIRKLTKIDLKEEKRDLSSVDFLDLYFEIFANKVVDKLDFIGIKRCKGGVMPSNEKWRASFKKWEERIKGKVTYGTGLLTVLDIIIIMDLRFVTGDEELGNNFMDMVHSLVRSNEALLTEMAESLILMPIPLGVFRKFILEKSGEHKGMLNLKLGGWAPLVFTLRIYAKKFDVKETSSINRIKELTDLKVFDKNFSNDLIFAYQVLMKNRILRQIELFPNMEGDNFLDPYQLPEEEQDALKKALQIVEKLQKKAHDHFFAGGFVQ